MRCFYYQRLLPTGQLKTGIAKLGFSRKESARYYLEQRQESVIVRLWMLPAWFTSLYDTVRLLGRKPLDQDELADFFHNLAVMQRSGIPMFEAMEELAADGASRQTRLLAEDILESLRSGTSLGLSLERHSDTVPQTVRHLVGIGESSGTLDRTLMDAAMHLRRVGKISQDAKRAMIYPAFVFTGIILAAVFWIVYVIPSLSDLFRQMQVEMPLLTRWLLAFSENVGHYLMAIVVALAGLGYGAWLLVRHNRRVRYRLHRLALRLPISRVLVRSASLAFITEYMSLLVAAGINIMDTLKVLEQSTGNEVFRESLKNIRKGMLRGNSLSSEMRLTGQFPGFVIRMISVGEQTGSLDTQLKHLAEDYRRRFDHLVGAISEIIKPAVMVLAGGLFILLIVALFLPVYELISQMNQVG